jgi:hypothetical protein
MKRLSIALLGPGLLALAACGGGGGEANTAETGGVDTANIQADDLTLPADNSLGVLPGDPLGNEGALGAGNAADLNAVGTADFNAADLNATNSQ